MPYSTATTRFPRTMVVWDAAKANPAGITTGTTVSIGVPAVGLLAWDTTKQSWVSSQINAAGAAAVKSALPIASGIITIASGSTTGTATIPSGLSVTTCRIESAVAGSATTAVVTSAPLFTIATTTLTVTVIDPAGGTSIYVSYALYAA